MQIRHFISSYCKIKMKKKDQRQYLYDIKYSQAVTHPSTNLVQCCLTSVIGRELVFQHGMAVDIELKNTFNFRLGLGQNSKNVRPTTPSIPRRSPIQVLTWFNVA